MPNRYPSFSPPHLSHKNINKSSEDFLKKYCPKDLPVPIEKIIEFNLDINIIPISDLKSLYDIDGFISGDLTAIYVDEYLYNHYEYRYRCTLAHEVAHLVLHKNIIQNYHPKDVDDWKDFIKQIDDDDYDWFEWQAYEFAGLCLVPKKSLIKLFNVELEKVQDKMNYTKSLNLNEDTCQEHIVGVIARKLQKKYDVSTNVLTRRIGKEISLGNISVP